MVGPMNAAFALLLVVHYCIFSLCAFYFFRLRSKFDIFSIAMLGAGVYFLPMLLPSNDVYVLNYLFCWVVLLALVAGSFFSNGLGNSSVLGMSSFPPIEPIAIVRCMVIFTLCFLLLQIYLSGVSSFLVSKQDQDRNGHIHMLYVGCLVLGFAYSFGLKSKKYVIFFVLNLVLLLLTGDRTSVFICTLVALLLSFRSLKTTNAVSLSFLFVLALIFVLGVYGKKIYVATAVAYKDDISYLEALARFQSGQETPMLELLYRSEPYHINEMLGKIVEAEFRVDSEYLLGIGVQFLPFSGFAGQGLHYFSREVKSRFYPGWSESSGVGASYWGEGYANFGFVGFLIFVGVFVGILHLLNCLYILAPSLYRPLFAVMGVYWGAYIHRNSIFQMIGHEKRVLYILLFTIVGMVLFASISSILRYGIRAQLNAKLGCQVKNDI